MSVCVSPVEGLAEQGYPRQGVVDGRERTGFALLSPLTAPPPEEARAPRARPASPADIDWRAVACHVTFTARVACVNEQGRFART